MLFSILCFICGTAILIGLFRGIFGEDWDGLGISIAISAIAFPFGAFLILVAAPELHNVGDSTPRSEVFRAEYPLVENSSIDIDGETVEFIYESPDGPKSVSFEAQELGDIKPGGVDKVEVVVTEYDFGTFHFPWGNGAVGTEITFK